MADKQLKERECAICGSLFPITSPCRKYCDRCREHKTIYRAFAEHSEKMMMLYDPPKMKEHTCPICGKSFVTVNRNLRDTGKETVCCSKKCKDALRRQRAACRYCGKPLKDIETLELDNRHTWYCSNECKEKDRREKAYLKDHEHTCERCGAKFLRAGGHFCSRECYEEAVADGWRPEQKTEKKSKYVLRNAKCPVCGSTHTMKYRLPLRPDVNFNKPVPCPGECRRRYEKHRKAVQARYAI